MKLLLDFFPILLFFVAYKLANIYVATAIAIAGSVLQLIYARIVLKRIEPMLWVSAGMVTVLGGLTLILRNPTFVMWKPTGLYWLMSLTLLISASVFKRNLVSSMMGKQVELPDAVWSRLNWAWVVFFACMGALNLAVAYNFSEATWVNFKLFGGLGLMLVFVFAQALFLSRYIQPENTDKQ